MFSRTQLQVINGGTQQIGLGDPIQVSTGALTEAAGFGGSVEAAARAGGVVGAGVGSGVGAVVGPGGPGDPGGPGNPGNDPNVPGGGPANPNDQVNPHPHQLHHHHNNNVAGIVLGLVDELDSIKRLGRAPEWLKPLLRSNNIVTMQQIAMIDSKTVKEITKDLGTGGYLIAMSFLTKQTSANITQEHVQNHFRSVMGHDCPAECLPSIDTYSKILHDEFQYINFNGDLNTNIKKWLSALMLFGHISAVDMGFYDMVVSDLSSKYEESSVRIFDSKFRHSIEAGDRSIGEFIRNIKTASCYLEMNSLGKRKVVSRHNDHGKRQQGQYYNGYGYGGKYYGGKAYQQGGKQNSWRDNRSQGSATGTTGLGANNNSGVLKCKFKDKDCPFMKKYGNCRFSHTD